MASRRGLLWLLVTLYVVCSVCGLDNGLARTPPMGWLSWLRFECNTDCMDSPDDCIGERLVMQMADAMVANGYKDAGYEYITLDDCWPAHERDAQGLLIGDPTRFPNGMKNLADYVHSKGMKLGLYLDVGRHTCAGNPGSQDHIQQDAQTMADWGVDMIKFDGCNTDHEHYQTGYPMMRDALNATGRKIMYSCEWPLYERAVGHKPNYSKVAETCNTWRVYGDIYDAWQSICSVLNYFGDNIGNFTEVAGPGNFNDGDMISVGDFGLSSSQERVQMAMWSMFASQMFLSVDLRRIRDLESRDLLQNPRVLAVSQDALGIAGRRVMKYDDYDLQYWVRPLSPQGSFALAFLNIKNEGYPIIMSANLTDLGLDNSAGYDFSEIFEGKSVGLFKPSQNYTIRVPPNSVNWVKAVPRSLPVARRNRKRKQPRMRISGMRNVALEHL